MRLISQNGKYDIPYEHSILSFAKRRKNTLSPPILEEFEYYIEAYLNIDNKYTMGVYSTKKKALEVMEEIRNEYVNCEFSWYQLPKDEEVACTD